MIDKILIGLIFTVALPGIFIAAVIGFFKRYGDGTGNESGMAEFFLWAGVANVAFYGWLVWYAFLR